jgi:phosphocarrier protein
VREVEVVIKDEVGLHARPAAEFVKLASRFKSNVTIEVKGKKAVAKSILEVLSLGAKKDDAMLIRAEGDDEDEAASSLSKHISTAGQ